MSTPKLDGRKVMVVMRVAVHPIKAALWNKRGMILPGMTLREIGAIIGVSAPQQIKHHLQAMVNMGAIDYIGGQYVFPPDDPKRRKAKV